VTPGTIGFPTLRADDCRRDLYVEQLVDFA
jgi:hypothetical protein